MQTYCIDPRRFSLQSYPIIHIPINVQTPDALVRIFWEVDGSSGSCLCRAWEGQHEIDRLQAAGYSITSINAD
jgi:hypothetical protein